MKEIMLINIINISLGDIYKPFIVTVILGFVLYSGYSSSKQCESENGSKLNLKRKSSYISRKEELTIMDQHRDIIGELYNEVVKNNTTEYTYHPLYINNTKNALDAFSDKAIGVEIIDPGYTDKTLSKGAVITDIIDVGGLDVYNRNIIDIKVN